MATVDNFFCIPDVSSKNVLEIYGENGSILCKGTIGQGLSGQMSAFLDSGSGEYDAKQSRSNSEEVEISPTPVNMYFAEIEEFSKAILEGNEPSNNAKIGLRSQKILAGCYESAKTSKAVQID